MGAYDPNFRSRIRQVDTTTIEAGGLITSIKCLVPVVSNFELVFDDEGDLVFEHVEVLQ